MKKKLAVTLLILNTLFLYSEESEKKQLKGDGVIAADLIKHSKEQLFLNSKDSLKVNIYVAENDVDSIKAVYINKKKKNIKDMEKMETEGKKVLYSANIEIAEEVTEYYFAIKDGSKTLYFGENNTYKEKECKPFKIKMADMKYSQTPKWVKESNAGYEIVIERYRNGNSNNDPITNEQCYKTINPAFKIMDDGIRSSDITGKDYKINGAEEFKLSGWGNNWNKKESWENKVKEYTKESRRYGGDLDGIKEKLEYIKKLGVDTIYLSPVFYSGSAYKDDAIAFNHVDPSFGRIVQTGSYTGEKVKSTKNSSEYILLSESKQNPTINNMGESINPESWLFTESDMVFIDFIKEAHKNGIRVVIEVNPAYISCSSQQFREVMKNGPDSLFKEWFLFKEWKNRDKGEDVWNPYAVYNGNEMYGVTEQDGKRMRRKWVQPANDMKEQLKDEIFEWNMSNVDYAGVSGQTGIVKLNYNNKPTAEYIKNSLLKWIRGYNGKIESKLEESDGIDGIKFKGVSEIEGSGAFDTIVAELKKENRELYVVKDNSYEKRAEVSSGEADGIINYGIGYNIFKLIVNKNREKVKPSEFVERVKQLYNGYPENVINNSLSVVDSADTDRIFSMTINPDRDYDRMNGSENESYKSIRADLYSENSINILKEMVVMQMILPGIPVIYYGDEKGMWGADDPENRKPMLWEDIKSDYESDTLDKYKKENKKFGTEVEVDEANGRIFYETKANEEISKFYETIIKFRNENSDILKNGELKFVYADDAAGGIAVERKSGKKSIVAVVNLTDKESSVKIPLESGDYQSIFSKDKFSVIDKVMEVKLKAREGLILIRK